MPYLDDLERLITPRLEPLGPIVFVRAHFQLTADHGLLTAVAAGALDLAARWTRSAVRSVYPQGSARAGFVSLLVDFSSGPAALLSAELTTGAEPSTMLLITGQRGTLRWDEYPEPGQLRELAGPRGSHWVSEVERASAAGRQIRTARE